MRAPAPDPRDDDRIAAAFLLQLRSDEEGGQRRDLGVYLRTFAGHEELVAREFVQAEEASRQSLRPALLPGARLAHFRIERPLGRGGQGEVHLATDLQLRRPVALKVLHGAGDRARLRFLREALAAARLEHPGICAVYESGDDDGYVWLAMRYVEGPSLRERLDSQGRLPAAEALPVVAAVADALDAAHRRGLVHRDVKPSNVILGPDGPVLLDLGLVHDDSGELATISLPGDMCGTPAYIAPERLSGEGRTDGRADVFALGVVLWECLAGENPFAAPTRDGVCHAVLHREPDPPRGWSRELRAVLAAALARDPDGRYATAGALAADLRRLRAGQPVQARRPGPLLRGWQWCRRHPVAATAAMVSFVSLAAGLVLSCLHLERETALRERLQVALADVRGIARTLAFDVWSQLRDVPGTTGTRQLALQRARELFERLLPEAPHDPELQRELLIALVRLGDVLGHDGIDNAGDPAAALDCYARAAELAHTLWPRAGDDPDLASVLLHAELHRADLAAATDLRAGLAAWAEVESRLRPLRRRWPAHTGLLRVEAVLELHTGNARDQLGDARGAVAHHEAAAAAFDRLAAQLPDDEDLPVQAAHLRVAVGRSLLRDGRHADGIARMRQGLAALGGDAPRGERAEHAWSQSALFLGSVLAEQGESAGARKLLDGAVEVRRRMSDRAGGDQRAGVMLASALYERGRWLDGPACADLRGALALCERLQAGTPRPHPGLSIVQCRCHRALALRLSAADPQTARAHELAAEALLQQLEREHPRHPELRSLRAAAGPPGVR